MKPFSAACLIYRQKSLKQPRPADYPRVLPYKKGRLSRLPLCFYSVTL